MNNDHLAKLLSEIKRKYNIVDSTPDPDFPQPEALIKDKALRDYIYEKYAWSCEFREDTDPKNYQLMETLISADLSYIYMKFLLGNYLEKENLLIYIGKSISGVMGLVFLSVVKKLQNYYMTKEEIDTWEPIDFLMYHVFQLYNKEIVTTFGGANESRKTEQPNEGGF